VLSTKETLQIGGLYGLFSNEWGFKRGNIYTKLFLSLDRRLLERSGCKENGLSNRGNTVYFYNIGYP